MAETIAITLTRPRMTVSVTHIDKLCLFSHNQARNYNYMEYPSFQHSSFLLLHTMSQILSSLPRLLLALLNLRFCIILFALFIKSEQKSRMEFIHSSYPHLITEVFYQDR